jgi:hypothetical protein
VIIDLHGLLSKIHHSYVIGSQFFSYANIQLPSYSFVHIGRKEQNIGEGETSDALHKTVQYMYIDDYHTLQWTKNKEKDE